MFLSCATHRFNKCTFQQQLFRTFIASGICYNSQAIIKKVRNILTCNNNQNYDYNKNYYFYNVMKLTLQDIFQFKTPYCFFGAYNFYM